MTSLDKYTFQQIIKDEQLLNEIDHSVFSPEQTSLKNALTFIQTNLGNWKTPTKEQFIELIKFNGQQDKWQKDEIELIFEIDEGVNIDFLEENFQKKVQLWKTRNILLNALKEYKIIEGGDFRNLSLDVLKNNLQKITKVVSEDMTGLSPKKEKLSVFNMATFPEMEIIENTPLKCGYPMWDKYHLLKKGCITTILGATGSRKSTFLMNLTGRLAQNGYNVLYVIIEGNIKRNINSIVAQVKGIGISHIEDEHYRNDIIERIDIAHQNYGTITVDDIEYAVKDKNYDAVVLDYVTLLTENDQNLFLKGQIISQKLKNVAENYDLGILTANQTNKPANNKIQLDLDDVGESHGITMAMDVMLGIIKYAKLENKQRTGLEIMKIRDIPDTIIDTMSRPLEGERELYEINYPNKGLTPVDDKDAEKIIKGDIQRGNDKRMATPDQFIESYKIDVEEDGTINKAKLFE